MKIPKLVRHLARIIRLRLLHKVAARRIDEIDEIGRNVLSCLVDESESVSAIRCLHFKGPGYHRETSNICWEAPICFLIYINDKPMFGVGIELLGKKIFVRQMQGAKGATIPKELRDWPRMCVEAIVEYAKESDITQVRLYRAHAELFYDEPYFEDGAANHGGEDAVRKRMRRRYDGTARQLRFTMQRNWGELDTRTQGGLL